MSQFALFAKMLAIHFTQMSQGELFRVALEGDYVWQEYLAAFPEGTNPIYRVRTEHDGSYDRNVIRQIGNVVRINDDGTVTSIWDIPDLPYPHNVVAARLAVLVSKSPIDNLFRSKEQKLGYVRTIEKLDDGGTQEWFHFHCDIAKAHQSKSPAADCGDACTTVGVFTRGLTELKPEVLDTVLQLIEQKSLYRGDEFKGAVEAFRNAQRLFNKQPDDYRRSILVWDNYRAKGIAKLRNTAVGTLLVNLSEGMDLEKAVKAYETIMAPANYKRPTALITQGMIDKAITTIDSLGLRSALERRFARFSDLSVNNVLWVDNDTQNQMKDGLADLLAGSIKRNTEPKFAGEMGVEEFMRDVLPTAVKMELFLANTHRTNLVSLTAPVHADAGSLFKWGNNFAWSYNGNIADSEMRQAVQAAGGRVDGAFRFTHSWNHDGRRNASLMDLHVFLPTHRGQQSGKAHDSYGNDERVGWNRRTHQRTGGVQDVDYTPAAPVGKIPVENITFPDVSRMPEGVYRCAIHNWSHRPPTSGGFKAEIEFDGQVFEYDYPEPLRNKEWVEVAEVTLKNGQFTIEHKLPSSVSSQDVWGLKTMSMVRVQSVLNSPNHWDGERTGNKHWFFILEGCKNPDPTRGIYNEFLKPQLDEHRKVFEILGAKTKCEPVDDQLSGLGFSSTKRDAVIVQVTTSSSTKTYKVNF